MTPARVARLLLVKKLFVAVAGTFFCLVFFEGIASLLLAFQPRLVVRPARPEVKNVAERRHTEFDPELGWIHRANCRVPGLYGRGKGLTTNGQRLRATADFSRELAPGRHRIVCVGDSFTLGYGVDDADTWPARLAALLPDSETANMGQGGYGVDQAWLWYRRDATFAHDTVLFAPIAIDFDRMNERVAYGFPKPWLELRDGKPVAANLPLVPPGPPVPPSGARRFLLWLHETSTLRVMEAAAHLLPRPSGDLDRPSERLVAAVLDDLRTTCAQRHARLVLVLLPTPYDDVDGVARWQRRLGDWASGCGVQFVDLTSAMHELPRDASAALYIDGTSPLVNLYPFAAGHYNEAGNRWVAERLAAALTR